MSQRSTRVAILAVALLALLSVVGLGIASAVRGPDPGSVASGSASAGPSTTASGAPSAGPGGSSTSSPAADPADSPSAASTGASGSATAVGGATGSGGSGTVGVPTTVRVPRLGIVSSLDRLHLDAAGAVEKPPHWGVAGWYAGGPRPGQQGPAVIAGHVDSPSGPAVFAALSQIRVGDAITVSDSEGVQRRFRVTRLRLVPKDGFPTRAVYGPTPDAELRLITCDGAYVKSRGGYQDNLVVFATEVSA